MLGRGFLYYTVIWLLASAVSAAASTGWGLSLLTNASEENSTQVTMSSFPGYTNGLDAEVPIIPDSGQPMAFIKIYHQANINGWDSTTGWYNDDMRDLIPLGTSVEFADIYIWAAPSYIQDTIPLNWYWHKGQTDPDGWTFTLSLLGVPDVSYTGPTTWYLEPSGSKTLPALLTELPTYRTTDGLQGYRLRLTAIHAVPEPGGFSVLASAALAVLMKMRKRN